jgi:uncharacterized repeat protein (TIGR04138 family)
LKKPSFHDAIEQIREEDNRYEVEAYLFIREALDFTIKMYKKPDSGPERHVTGQELTEGIRQYALREFGPLAQTVLEHWGIHQTEDFGYIVFNLVEKGILGKTDQDSPRDFANVYDFNEAFKRPFLPGITQPRHPHRN